jgi:YfiH family protein
VFAYLSAPERGGIGVAFTDRWGGVSSSEFATLNLGRTDRDRVSDVVENFSRVRGELGVGSVHVVNQVHGVDVHRVTSDDIASWTPTTPVGDAVARQSALPAADAIVTDLPGAAVAVRVADCLPVILADPARRIVAAVHAGRVGLLAGVVQQTLADLSARGATSLHAWIGPHICGACYEVGEKLRDHAASVLPATAATTSWGTPSIDLSAGAVSVLEAAGVTIEHVGGCTLTDPALFSHRGDPKTGRQLGMVWIAPDGG